MTAAPRRAIRRASLDARIAALEAKIPKLKPHSEDRAHAVRDLTLLRIERMRRDTKFRNRRRAA